MDDFDYLDFGSDTTTEDILDIYGTSGSDILLGKDIDWTRPYRIFAIILLVAILGDMLGSFAIEFYRLRAMQDEIMCMERISAQTAETNYQMVKPQDYMFNGTSLNPTYANYAVKLQNIGAAKGDAELTAIGVLLASANSTPSKQMNSASSQNTWYFTPLNFGLTYLEEEKLSEDFKSNLMNLSNAALTNPLTRGSLSSALQELLLGKERYKIMDARAEVQDLEVLDITNIATADQHTKDMYAAVYGTLDPAASQTISSNQYKLMTDKHYLVVYPVTYTVEWVPYTGTNFFWRPDKSALTPDWLRGTGNRYRNSYGYVRMTNINGTHSTIKTTYTTLYYQTH